MNLDILRSFTYEQFQQFLGQTFEVRFDDGSIDLILDRVTLLMEKHISPQMKRDAFSLHFRGPGDRVMGQGMYPMHHETLGGPLPIFIVPIGPEPGGFIYEAVFN